MRAGPPVSLALLLVACGATPTVSPPARALPPPTSAQPPAPEAVVAPESAALKQRISAIAQTRNHRLGTPGSFAFPKGVNGVFFLQSEREDPRQSLYFANLTAGKVELFLRASDLAAGEETLSAAEKARRERMRLTTKGFSQVLPSPDGTRLLLPLGGKLFVIPLEIAKDGAAKPGKSVLLNADGATDPQWSPDGAFVAYVRDGNLYRSSATGRGDEQALTTGGTAAQPLATAEFVAQEEFGRSRGYWFSPDGRQVLIETVDQRKVERIAIVDPAHPENDPDRPYYPRAGRENATIGFALVDVATKKRTVLPWKASDFPYVATVTWVGETPFFYATDRPQKRAVLLAWDGKAFVSRGEERDSVFVNTEGLRPYALSKSAGSGFVRAVDAGSSSVRVGHFSEDGTPRGTLLPATGAGGWELKHIVAVEADGAVLAVVGQDGTDGRFARLRAAKTPEFLTGSDRESVDAVCSEDGVRCVTAHFPATGGGLPSWTVGRPGAAPVLSIAGRWTLPSPLPAPTFLRVGSDKIAVSVIAPSYPIPKGAKLPVIDAAYGGPGVTIVSPNVLSYARSQWIADAVGAYVIAIDSEGTPGRGRDFERKMGGAFGTTPIDGHMATLRALQLQKDPALAQADFSRIGVFGWSFGGYFSALAAVAQPGFYRVAVAGAPPADWRDYDTAYTERYLGVPGTGGADESYKRSNLLVRAAEATSSSPLLLIHGTADDNVYFSQSLKLAQAMEQRGLPVEFYPIAGATHLLVDPEETVRVWTRVAQFLKAGLAAEPRGDVAKPSVPEER